MIKIRQILSSQKIKEYLNLRQFQKAEKELKKAEKLRKSWGTQLKIPFPNEK